MIVGNKARFAFEFELDGDCLRDPELGMWVYGRLRVWCKGGSIGDWEDVTALSSVASQLRSVERESGRRVGGDLCAMEPAAVVAKVVSALFDDDGRSDEDVEADMREFGPFLVMPITDGLIRWRLVLVDCRAGSRLIWRDDETGAVDEVALELGEFERVVTEMICRLRDAPRGDRSGTPG